MAMPKTIIRRKVPSLPPLLEHPILNRIFLARGVISADELEYSLTHLINPLQLKGIELALDLLTQAFLAQKKLLIVGDFDADGATSTALAVRGLRALGFKQVDFLAMLILRKLVIKYLKILFYFCILCFETIFYPFDV